MNSVNIHVSILSSVVFCCESETLHEMQCKGNNSCVLLQNGSSEGENYTMLDWKYFLFN